MADIFVHFENEGKSGLTQAAEETFNIFKTFVSAGFSEEQALKIIIGIMTISAESAKGKEDK